MAASLVAMVARLSVGKKKYKEIEPQMLEIIGKADRIQEDLTKAVKIDSEAFEDVMAAYKLPKASEEEINIRGIAIEAAMLHAAKVPLGVAEMAVEAMELASIVTEIGNLNAISDGASGNAVARASFTGAVLNVKINLASLTDQDETKKLIESISSLEKRADSAEAKVNANIKNRADL
ncbi:MAG: cyclodeaminase/cyclohydrolase family protein, partial [Chloroflexi bacterium]|nr:cyclodeaminase/cyclohydrolase family protein [Chloroflexota bacterium]